jgi:hypothetical protein
VRQWGRGRRGFERRAEEEERRRSGAPAAAVLAAEAMDGKAVAAQEDWSRFGGL